MRKHPGIWFSLWSIITILLLSFEMAYLPITQWIGRSFLFLWSAECIYWVTIFHVRWIEGIMKKRLND